MESGSTKTLASCPIESIATDRPFVTESIGFPAEDSMTTWNESVNCFDPGFFNIPMVTVIMGFDSVDGSHAPSIRRLRNAFEIVSSPVLSDTVAAALNFELFPSWTKVSYAV